MKSKMYMRKAVIFLAILSMIFGLSGCSEGKKYTADDIELINTVYYGTSANPVYSFALMKKNGSWLFSANCYLEKHEGHYTSFSSFQVPSDEAEEFLAILREEGEIERIQKHKNSKSLFNISDTPAYSTGITFADGSVIEKNITLGDRALEYLYELADKYYEAAEKETITKVTVGSTAMLLYYSYAFTLEKDENTWFFSFTADIDDGKGHMERTDLRVNEDDALEILAIVKEQQLVDRVNRYEEPEDDDTIVLDETTYNTSFEFADGSFVSAPINPGTELVEAFYSLAGKYQIR